jgi:ribonuclease D
MNILNKPIKIYQGDISENDVDYILEKCSFITVDTETTGLDPINDELCLIQIYDGSNAYILKYSNEVEYINLIKILQNSNVTKVFHHANFDLRFLVKNLKINNINNVSCTKVSAKLLNGKNENSSLKYLCKRYLNIDMNKEMQTSDWSKKSLSDEQLEYALNDVIYLYELWNKMKLLLEQKDVFHMAQKCFDYLPVNALLNNEGIENIFIY